MGKENLENLINNELNSYEYSFKYSIEIENEDYAEITFIYDNVEIEVKISYDEYEKELVIHTYSEGYERLTSQSLFEQMFWRSLDKIENLKYRLERIKDMCI